MTHKLKIERPFADAIVEGKKTFEIRYNDRGFQAGDELTFQCVDKAGCSVRHDINDLLFQIDYVLSGFGLKEGYCVFSFRNKF